MRKLLATKTDDIPSPISTNTTSSMTTQANKDEMTVSNFDNVSGNCKPLIKCECPRRKKWWLGTHLTKTKQEMLNSPILSKWLR